MSKNDSALVGVAQWFGASSYILGSDGFDLCSRHISRLIVQSQVRVCV